MARRCAASAEGTAYGGLAACAQGQPVRASTDDFPKETRRRSIRRQTHSYRRFAAEERPHSKARGIEPAPLICWPSRGKVVPAARPNGSVDRPSLAGTTTRLPPQRRSGPPLTRVNGNRPPPGGDVQLQRSWNTSEPLAQSKRGEGRGAVDRCQWPSRWGVRLMLLFACNIASATEGALITRVRQQRHSSSKILTAKSECLTRLDSRHEITTPIQRRCRIPRR